MINEIKILNTQIDNGRLSVRQEREHIVLLSHGAKVVTLYGRTGVDKFMERLKDEN